MANLTKELVYLVMQYLDEEKYKNALRELEKDSGVFFNMKYFEDCIINGELEDADNYLSGFTEVDENRHSMKMFFEIRKQRYLEALDKDDIEKALQILKKDLKVYDSYNNSLFKDVAHLLSLKNFRENAQLANYVDAKTARTGMMTELRRLIQTSPQLRDKLQFPILKRSRLCTLINQSLNWQHQLCKYPKLDPDIRTLFADHICVPPCVTNNSIVAPVPKIGSKSLLQPTQSPVGLFAAGGSSSVPHQSGAGGPVSMGFPNNAVSTLKKPRTPLANNSAMNCQLGSLDQIFKRMKPGQTSKEVNNVPVNVIPVNSSYTSDDLPKNVFVNLSQCSAVKSMDFHPSEQTFLLVGMDTGDVAIWEIGTREKLIHQNFQVWDIDACSTALQIALSNENTASVNRVRWSPDGALFGVAFSKHIVHLYYYHGGNELHRHLEIEGHRGNVYDVAFSMANEHLYVITCGEDTSVKVWNVVTGSKLYTFEGHEAAVYSVCPHHKENIQFIFSTDNDGKIKGWLYDNLGARIELDSPGCSRTIMAYSADGTRLFSCGTNEEGESHLVEWNEDDGTIKRSYSGLGNKFVGLIHFDTIKNKFLAVGDEFVVKIWDMDGRNVIKTIDADGGLPVSPCIRFNKQGTLLAVSTNDNGVKILAKAEAPWTTSPIETRALDPSQIASSSIAPGTPAVAPVIFEGEVCPNSKKLRTWKWTEIKEVNQIHSFRLPDNLSPATVVWLTYTHSGNAILSLHSTGIHKLWRWQRNEHNLTGKATATISPLLWLAGTGNLMVNDMSGIRRVEEAIHSFALSKNDSYAVSASGGKISLYNILSFKTITTFLSPPPMPTSLAFDPMNNNVIAVGLEDGTILIYCVRFDEVRFKFKGHQKRVTHLAFSTVGGIFVSSGADKQVCVWSRDVWRRRGNWFIQIPKSGHEPSSNAPTHFQFHQDQIHVLVVHETHLSVYDTSSLECISKWIPKESHVSITDATYSCDSQSVYAGLNDGNVFVLIADTLLPKCQIKRTAYFGSFSRTRMYPATIAAHPSEPNQFAIGLSDGGVLVLEPRGEQGKWGDGSQPPPPPPVEESSSSAASTTVPPLLELQMQTN